MKKGRRTYLGIGVLGAILAGVLAVSLACASEDPTATPVAPAQPAAPSGPTGAPVVAPTLAPGVPTPFPVQPTPTRVLPTVTPVAMEKVQYGGTLITSTSLTLRGMDTAAVTGGLTNVIGFLVYNNVVQVSSDLEIIPDLARSWDITQGGKVITFHLQPGAMFHDGTPADAEAVKWNFDRQADKEIVNLQRHAAAQIDKIDVLDASTLRITLNTPFRPFLSFLAELPGMMMSPTAIVAQGSYEGRVSGAARGVSHGTFSRSPVGSGPFIFKEWIPDLQVKIERNPDYWEEGKPFLDGITWLISFDSTVRLAMLRTGQIKFLDRLTRNDVQILEKTSSLVIDKWDAGAFSNYSFVVTAPPFDNKALRQAIAHATDRKTLIDLFYNGDAQETHSMIGAGWAKNPDLKVYEFSLQKAREKLVEAGYPNGITVPLFCASTAEAIENCEIWQAMLEPVGIDANITIYPAAEGRLRRTNKENLFTAPGAGTSSPTVDPFLGLFSWLGCTGGQADTNYCNPEFERLLQESGQEFDTAKAKLLYDEIQRIAIADVPKVFIAWPTIFTSRDPMVQGFVYNKDNDARFRDVWLKR